MEFKEASTFQSNENCWNWIRTKISLMFFGGVKVMKQLRNSFGNKNVLSDLFIGTNFLPHICQRKITMNYTFIFEILSSEMLFVTYMFIPNSWDHKSFFIHPLWMISGLCVTLFNWILQFWQTYYLGSWVISLNIQFFFFFAPLHFSAEELML